MSDAASAVEASRGNLPNASIVPATIFDPCVDLDQHLVVGALVEIERSDLDGLVHRGADRLEYRLRGPRMGLRRA